MNKIEREVAYNELRFNWSPNVERLLAKDNLMDNEQTELIRHLKYLEKYLPSSKVVKEIRNKLELGE